MRSLVCPLETRIAYLLEYMADINPDNGFDDSVPTVDGLFQLIQDAITAKVAQLTVSYDAALGYPTNVYIDRGTMRHNCRISYRRSISCDQDLLMVDEEIGYEVKDLSVLRTREYLKSKGYITPDEQCRKCGQQTETRDHMPQHEAFREKRRQLSLQYDTRIEEWGVMVQEGRLYYRFDEYCKHILQALERENFEITWAASQGHRGNDPCTSWSGQYIFRDRRKIISDLTHVPGTFWRALKAVEREEGSDE